MNRLWVRLSLAFSAVVLLGVATIILMSILVAHTRVRQIFLDSQVRAPGGLAEALADYHQTHDGWDGVEILLKGARAAVLMGPRDHILLALADAEGQIVYHTRAERVGQPLSQTERAQSWPIQAKGAAPEEDEAVGYLHIRLAPAPKPSPGRHFFLAWLSRVLLMVAIIGGVLGILFGVVVSRSLTAPLSRLAEAARAVGAGDFRHRVEVTGSDEVIEVARAFNDMTGQLEQAEIVRRNLVADAAHELRTPLSVLQGNLRAILDDVYTLDKSEIARLYDQTRLLGHLVDDLRELAQAEAGQLQLDLAPIDLVKLVQDTAATFEPVAEAAEIALSVESPDGLPPAQADAARLGQVLHNLLDNALRHTPAGGTITLSAGCEENPPDEAAYCWLAVQDTGDGISAEDLPHVFDRFYRADRARSRATGGAGLGLAIVRAIVEAHGGQISAASEGVPGQGSTFTVRLPL
jgi:two-component system OmpR family sensor kinase/two-component system sensor histidine kinase BaeS